MSGVDYYKVLGLLPTASKSEMVEAYKKLVHRYHPDHNVSVSAREKLKIVKKAFEILTDDQKRKSFDSTRQPPSSVPPLSLPEAIPIHQKPQQQETPDWHFRDHFKKTAKQKEISQRLTNISTEYSTGITIQDAKRDQFHRSHHGKPEIDGPKMKMDGSKREEKYYELQAEFYENERRFFEKEKVLCQLQKENGQPMTEQYEKKIEDFDNKMAAAQRQAEFYRERAAHYGQKERRKILTNL